MSIVNFLRGEDQKLSCNLNKLSFCEELNGIAKILHENKMPQETINMVLAAYTGLPIQPLDAKSPCFMWVEEVTQIAVSFSEDPKSAVSRQSQNVFYSETRSSSS